MRGSLFIKVHLTQIRRVQASHQRNTTTQQEVLLYVNIYIGDSHLIETHHHQHALLLCCRVPHNFIHSKLKRTLLSTQWVNSDCARDCLYGWWDRMGCMMVRYVTMMMMWWLWCHTYVPRSPQMGHVLYVNECVCVCDQIVIYDLRTCVTSDRLGGGWSELYICDCSVVNQIVL